MGGLQAGVRAKVLSTQGHNFRIRAASDGRMLMQHTLNDLVIRGCEEDVYRDFDAEFAAIQKEVWRLESERDSWRESLAAELSRYFSRRGGGRHLLTPTVKSCLGFVTELLSAKGGRRFL